MGFFQDIFSEGNNLLTGGKADKADDARQRALDAMQNVELPTVEEMQIHLETLVQQGQLSPEEAQVYLQQRSEMNGVSTDPALMNAQYDALQGLQDVANEDGLTAVDKAKLSAIQTEQDTHARGQREAILQNAQARGMGGSGMEMLAQLQNQQDSATRGSQRGMDVAAMAQERALQALMGAGNMGNQMQQTQFGQKAQVAKSNDAINQFNTQNMQTVGNINTQNRNVAAEKNLGEKQRVADTNVGTRNQQEAHNKGLHQQNFQNAIQKAGGEVAAYANQADGFQTGGEQTYQKYKNEQENAMQMMQMGAMMSDMNEKEDIEEFDPSEFLDSLTGYKYNYKKPEKYGEGRHAGIMAQDLEKTEEGRAMVDDVDGKKSVNFGKGFGTILASVAEMNERLKRLEGK